VNAAQFNRISKALAEPRRVEILEAIAQVEELSCGEIVEKFPVSQATISHHIKELVNAGLAEPRRDGQYCYYRICPEVLANYIAELQQLVLISQAKQKSQDLV